MRYPHLVSFTAPARAQAELWRTALGVLGIAALYFAALFLVLNLLAAVLGDLRFAQVIRGMLGGSTPQGLALMLASFVPMAAAAAFVTRALHGRDWRSLLGHGAAMNFLRVAVPLTGLSLALMPLDLLDPNVGRATPLATVLGWLPLALPLLALQVGAEELVFRGYLLQQLGARSRSPLVWMVLPSALFGMLHYAPADFGPNAIWPVLWAFTFGCMAADLTARTGNLGAALGLHFATNFAGMFLVGLYGNLDGLSLYTLVINTRDTGALGPYLAQDFLAMAVSWLLARLMLRV
jgi:membrane protease YdiL (CAAX protease family)